MDTISKTVNSVIFGKKEMTFPKDYTLANLIFDFYEELIYTNILDCSINFIKIYVYSKKSFENYGDPYEVNTKITDTDEELYLYVECINN